MEGKWSKQIIVVHQNNTRGGVTSNTTQKSASFDHLRKRSSYDDEFKVTKKNTLMRQLKKTNTTDLIKSQIQRRLYKRTHIR